MWWKVLGRNAIKYARNQIARNVILEMKKRTIIQIL